MKNGLRIGILILAIGFGIGIWKLNSKPEIEIEIQTEYYNPAWDIEATELPEPEPWFPISDEDRQTIIYMVAGEAAGESFKGKKLVAQCIYSAMRCDGLSAEEVRTIYRYDGWKTDLETESPEAYEDVVLAVSEVFDDGVLVVDDWIFYFYAPKLCKGNFHKTQRFVIEEGGHRFYGKWE